MEVYLVPRAKTTSMLPPIMSRALLACCRGREARNTKPSVTPHASYRSSPSAILIASKFLAAIAVLAPGLIYSEETKLFMREEFSSLENWAPFTFNKIHRSTDYSIESQGSESSLRVLSNDSASAIVYKYEFDVYQYPYMKWRWLISNVYRRGDAATKAGDDYPIRVYVIFGFDPSEASFRKRVQYAVYKAVNGRYPPASSLNYIWANKEASSSILDNAYSEESKMIILQAGEEKAGVWVEETVNILNDYQRAFGSEPPSRATIAIMGDADDTRESSRAYVDFIEIFDTNE